MVNKISHVGIATRSIDSALGFYRLLGLEPEKIETHDQQKVRAVLLRIGQSSVELLEALDEDSPIARFVEKRGEGIHHISMEVEDLEKQLDILQAADVCLVGKGAEFGVEGGRIVFVHPRSTGGVLIELCQPAAGE
jgi:methylmalonyl-CoA epimerase